MSTWSKSAIKSSSSIIVSDKSFPALGGDRTSGPPSKKPVLSFAQKVKEKAEADEAAAVAAAEAKKNADTDRAEAQRLLEIAERRQVTLGSTYYKSHHSTDEYYVREDSSPDEMDYESALEYEEHLRYNRRMRGHVVDYSKDLSSEEDERAGCNNEYDNAI